MRVALLSPGFDGTDVGEAYVAFKWAEALSREVDLTVLALQRQGRRPLAGQLPGARVVTWPEPPILLRAERLNAMLKPAWPILFRRVRAFLAAERRAGRGFDLGHQIMPQSPRYPSPFQRMGFPYVLGPVGGALPTPEGFRSEMKGSAWYTRLRALDTFRLKHDPWLRATYAEADLVVGVAPYVASILSPVPLRRFETELELGIDPVSDPPPPLRPSCGGPLRLLHVGRGVRSKGLREVVRAMARLGDLDVRLISAGSGPEIEACRSIARDLGVADRITFEGMVPRARVNELYAEADIFVFPSFREPAGNVLYEAMLAALPIVTADYGGPADIVDAETGIQLAVTTPEAMVEGVEAAVRALAADPARRQAMGQAGRARVLDRGPWPRKAARMAALYREIIAGAGTRMSADLRGFSARSAE